MKENVDPVLIKNKDIPVKSPYMAPLDFFGFEHFKQKAFHRRATALNGLWHALKKVLSKITPEKCREVFSALKKRCRLLLNNIGHHIEQVNHQKKIRI